MADSTKVTVPAIKWAIENYKLIFHFIKVLSDYPSFCKGIWPAVRERILGISKINCCQNIAEQLFLQHKIYGFYIHHKEERLQVYSQLVKHQIQKIETIWKAAYKMF